MIWNIEINSLNTFRILQKTKTENEYHRVLKPNTRVQGDPKETPLKFGTQLLREEIFLSEINEGPRDPTLVGTLYIQWSEPNPKEPGPSITYRFRTWYIPILIPIFKSLSVREGSYRLVLSAEKNGRAKRQLI